MFWEIKRIKINKENDIKHGIIVMFFLFFLVTFAMPAGKKKEPLPGPSRCVLIIIVIRLFCYAHPCQLLSFDFQNECKYLRWITNNCTWHVKSNLSPRKHLTFCNSTTCFPTKWLMRKDCRNSILINDVSRLWTRSESASWLAENLLQLIVRSTTQIC